MGNIRRNRLDNVHVDGLNYVGQGLGNLLLVGVATSRNVSEGYSERNRLHIRNDNVTTE